jgi:hypothetical protein
VNLTPLDLAPAEASANRLAEPGLEQCRQALGKMVSLFRDTFRGPVIPNSDDDAPSV